MNSVPFNVVVPLEKAERDGRWIITGVASGLGVDNEGHYVTPEGIQRMADQINQSPLPFRDQHNVNSIAEDMGYFYKAEIDKNWNLHVEAELDQDNPNAQYLWNKISKGKKYGLSVKGKTLGSYRGTDKESGRSVVYHPHPLLDEISATTRPMWSPSLGTVIKKAMDENFSLAANGDWTDMSEQNAQGEQQVQGASAPDNATVTNTPSNEEVASIIVKAMGQDETFLSLIRTAAEEAVKAAQPVAQEESSDTSEDNTEVSKSESTAQSDDVTEIVKSAVAEVSANFSAQLQRLADRIPESVTPGVLIKSQEESDTEILAGLREDPRQALRASLAYAHGEQSKLR